MKNGNHVKEGTWKDYINVEVSIVETAAENWTKVPSKGIDAAPEKEGMPDLSLPKEKVY